MKKSQANQLIEVVNSIPKSIAEAIEKQTTLLTKLIDRVNNLESNVWDMATTLYVDAKDLKSTLHFCIDGANIDLVGDYRVNKLIEQQHAKIVYFVDKEGKTETKYTATENLTEDEKIEHDTYGYILKRKT
jgi:hypothetical protein